MLVAATFSHSEPQSGSGSDMTSSSACSMTSASASASRSTKRFSSGSASLMSSTYKTVKIQPGIPGEDPTRPSQQRQKIQVLHDLHEDDHRGEAISGRVSTSRVEHHEPLLAIPEVTNRCIITSGQSLQRCIAHLDQLIRVETVKIFEQSSKSLFLRIRLIGRGRACPLG